MLVQYVYLLQEREFIKTQEQIYKLGKTRQPNNERLKQYPKQSVLLFQMVCKDCDMKEKEILRVFKQKFIHRKDIGQEYFEGVATEMIDEIYRVVRDISIR